MRISFLSLRQGRLCIFAGLLICAVTLLIAKQYEDGIHLILASIAFLLVVSYWHFVGYYVHIAQDQVVLQNELHRVIRSGKEVWKVVSVSGPVYQIIFRDQATYSFVSPITFPFYRDFGKNKTQADAILDRIKGPNI